MRLKLHRFWLDIREKTTLMVGVVEQRKQLPYKMVASPLVKVVNSNRMAICQRCCNSGFLLWARGWIRYLQYLFQSLHPMLILKGGNLKYYRHTGK